MPHASDLLEDAFAFLCFLHADDVAPRGRRWLPPRALARLNARLRAPDAVELAARGAAGGKRGTTERETQRIRFVHFVCEAARLVAPTGGYLKPTPGVARWLDAAHWQGAAQLFQAAFPRRPDRSHDDIWRAYRLPGFKLDSPSLRLAALLDILRQAPRGERIRLSTLLRLAPLAALDDDPDTRPEAILGSVLDYLAWFGVITWRERWGIQITEWGALLLERADAGDPPPDAPLPPAWLEIPVLLGEGQSIGMRLSAERRALYELAEYAEPIAVKPQRRYRLERARVRRALERGATLDHILRFLELASGATLPRPVEATLRQWAGDLDRVTLRRVTLLEARDPQLLAEVARERTARRAIRRTLSPRAVILRDERLTSLVRHLERRGLSPRLDFPRPVSRMPEPANDSSSAPARNPIDALFDQPTLAHLYLAARIGHQLSDLVPPACRAPYSILLDLERRLDPRERDLAARLADEAAEHIRAAGGQARPAGSFGARPDSHDLTPRLSLIQRAIEATAALEIVYTDARRETTTRVVEPHGLEWRGRTAYLVAFCRLERDERTFRVDRIEAVRSGE